MMNAECRILNEDRRSNLLRILHPSSFILRHFLILLLRLYRLTLSPAKTFLCGPLAQCRFTPSCSAYGLEALQLHGAGAGSWLAVKRICRCHPWGDCGHDPVPKAESRKQKAENQMVPGRCS